GADDQEGLRHPGVREEIAVYRGRPRVHHVAYARRRPRPFPDEALSPEPESKAGADERGADQPERRIGGGHTAPIACMSRSSVRRPASSTRPESASIAPVTSTGTVSPMTSEATPMSHGEAASPSRCMTIVVTAKPRARRSAGRTLAMAAFSGPTFTNSSNRVTNIDGQNTLGDGARTACTGNASEPASGDP